MADIIMLSNVRLSFPHLVEPQKKDTGKSSYNAEFIMPPDHPGFQQFMRRVAEIATEKWKEHGTNVLSLIQQDRKKRCYGSGAEKINGKTFQPYDGYEGMVYVTAGREQMPQIIQADGTPIDPTDTMKYQALTRAMYGGCRVNVALKPWTQDNQHGRGIRCDLAAIQFAGNDTPFGEGATDASGLFSAAAAPAPAFLGAPAPQAAPNPFGAALPAGPANPFAPPAQAAPAMPPAPFPAPQAPGLPAFLQ